MALLSPDFRVNLGTPETEIPVPKLLEDRVEMVALILENICLPGTARILIDFSTVASSDPTAVQSLPSTYLQEWQDQPVATKRILARNETGGVLFNSSPWLRHIISDANALSETATYRWTENGNTTLRPVDNNGSLFANRAETTDPFGYNPHTTNLFFPQLESGERVGWIDAVEANTTPTTLVITGLVAATSASIGAGITLNRYDSGELTYVTSIPITAAGALGPYTINITIPDDYWVVLSGFENAVIVGGFTVTQSWNCGTWAHLPTEKFFDLTQRYGRGQIRMLAHSCLIKCGAVVTTEGVSIGYLTVARLENDLDWYQMITSAKDRSLFTMVSSYGNRKLTYTEPFVQGAHFFQLPKNDWDKMRTFIDMDPVNATVRDLSYRREVEFWTPMIWCIKSPNPEGNNVITACSCLIEEDQSFSYTTSNPDHTEVSPAFSSETQRALDLLKNMKAAREVDAEEAYQMTERQNPAYVGQNSRHLMRILGGIADVMNQLGPVKKMGMKYVQDSLMPYIGAQGASGAAQAVGGAWDALAARLAKKARGGGQ